MQGVDRAAIVGALILSLVVFFLFQAHDALTRPPPKFDFPADDKTATQSPAPVPPTHQLKP
jgi:hypothetical protein